ncbi:Iron-regulated transcriptional activator AFT1 [Nakaseomyces bracarensis]|uniref:Iron-regulated transcriptional activator AFT1 n=1 Tax=Nakaseomyces bracarensis TaxID=273131 RepID=A0ABR4NVQ9_9SACH
MNCKLRKGIHRRSLAERLICTPEKLKNAMAKNQSKLIHLDPVPHFTEKLDIKIWLQKMFFPMGIDIVIERSDKCKIIFKCKPSDYRSHEPKEFRADESEDNKRRLCPFRVRATFSTQLKKWNIVIINNGHTHELKFKPHSDEYAKFKKNLRDRGDMETLKEFEELEYKYKLNLPTENMLPGSKIVPCECGLTQEIKTLNNIYLPLKKDPILEEIDVTKFINPQGKYLKKKIKKQKISKPYDTKYIKCKPNTIREEPKIQNNLTDCAINDVNDYDCDKYFSDMLEKETYADIVDCTILNFDNFNEIDFTEMFNKSKQQEPPTKSSPIITSNVKVGVNSLVPSEASVQENLLDPELFAALGSDTSSTSIDEFIKMPHSEQSSPISPSSDSIIEVKSALDNAIGINQNEYFNKFIDFSQAVVKKPYHETNETVYNQ